MELDTLDRLSDENRKSQRVRRYRAVGFALLLVVFVGDRIINGKRGEEQHQKVLQQLKLIAPPSETSVFAEYDGYSPWNPGKVACGAKYKSRHSFAEIGSYYNQELTSLGWRIADNHVTASGTVTTYCKGDLAATLAPGVQDTRRPWTYALDLAWRPNNCK
jgi:hypothetical protein